MLTTLGKIIQRIGGFGGAILLLIGAVQMLTGGFFASASGIKNVVFGLLIVFVTGYIAKALGHKD